MSNSILKALSSSQLEKYKTMFYACGQKCCDFIPVDTSLCDIGVGEYCNGIMNGTSLEDGGGLWIEPGNVDSAFKKYLGHKNKNGN